MLGSERRFIRLRFLEYRLNVLPAAVIYKLFLGGGGRASIAALQYFWVHTSQSRKTASSVQNFTSKTDALKRS